MQAQVYPDMGFSPCGRCSVDLMAPPNHAALGASGFSHGVVDTGATSSLKKGGNMPPLESAA